MIILKRKHYTYDSPLLGTQYHSAQVDPGYKNKQRKRRSPGKILRDIEDGIVIRAYDLFDILGKNERFEESSKKMKNRIRGYYNGSKILKEKLKRDDT